MIQRLGSGALPLVVTTALALALLVLALSVVGGWFGQATSNQPLVVYCAAGVRPAVEPMADQYKAEFGIAIEIQSGSSGALEAQIRASKGLRSGDLYIPAAEDPFIDRNRAGTAAAEQTGREPFLAEVIPLAKFRLVLAVAPGNPKNIRSLDDLFKPGISYLTANDEAAVGRKTKEVLEAAGQWERVRKSGRQLPTVTEIVTSVLLGSNADAGFIWDANARQHNLEIVEIPELQSEPSRISASVITTSTNPTGALRFARYLAAPEKGQKSFARLHYDTVDGDPWAVTPNVVLFSGGVNRDAIEETIKEFQQREGCTVIPTYGGCGSLVATMKTGQNPDAYFACDLSFLDMVQDRFAESVNVTNTDMVMLVRGGNPKNIRTLEDLAKDGIAVGMADEKLSALGRLTVDLLKSRGLYEQVVKNRKASSPTAHFLVLQLTEPDKLDAVIVYRANCNNVAPRGEIVAIDDPRANAIQPFAVHREAQYPQLTKRLRDAITSAKSQKRFTEHGFHWQLGGRREQDSP